MDDLPDIDIGVPVDFTEQDVLEVSFVCPDVPVDIIRKDLLLTKNKELTVNRIFDGQLTESCHENHVQPATSSSNQSHNSGHFSSDCSTTDVNSDNELPQNQVIISPKDSNDSGTDINSDDGIEIVSERLPAKSSLTVENKESNHSTMYGSHGLSDSEDDSRSNQLSISSDDHIAIKERKPLSALLGIKPHKGDNLDQNMNVDEDELPDLDSCGQLQYNADDLDSLKPDSFDKWSTGSLSNSQNSGYSTTSTALSSITTCSSSTSSDKGKKKRRTPEEIEESKKQALELKAKRERDKKEKEERKKREVLARKALQEAKKQSKPGDCMKYITVVVDLDLVNSGPGAAVLAAFDDSPVKCVAESSPIPNTVTWRRLVVEHQVLEEARLHTVEREERQTEVLLVLSTTDFLQLVNNSKLSQTGCYSEGCTLTNHVKHIQQVFTDCNLTLIALGMDQYFKDKKTELQRKHRNAVRGTETAPKKRAKTQDSGILLSRVEMEEVLVGLSLETNCNCQLINSSKDLVDLVKTFTKAVGEAPGKKDRLESAFSFHCEGGGGGKVNKNGVGLLKVWKQQLQQFKTISGEMANAIVASYPSPRLLVEAYRECSSEREAERLLEDIVVRRGAGALTTNRRIGKELSRRVYQLMTFTDPEFIIT